MESDEYRIIRCFIDEDPNRIIHNECNERFVYCPGWIVKKDDKIIAAYVMDNFELQYNNPIDLIQDMEEMLTAFKENKPPIDQETLEEVPIIFARDV